jgi:hypothetical protein
MALIAICAVVNVAAHIPVVPVRLRFRMTNRAAEDRVIGRIGVTGRTHTIGPAMIGGEPGVIECRSSPRCRRMAGLACRWETGRRVIGIGGALVFGGMARIAVHRRPGEFIVQMALTALDAYMGSCQGKGCLAVIESGSIPRIHPVTGIACCG